MTVRILVGDWVDVLKTLPAESVHMTCTSPPYFGLRDYGTPGQLGLERTVDEYVARLVDGFREVKRVLRDDAVMFVNLGDTYQDKQLLGVPWRVAFALQADGWWLRSDIVWSKPNPMPESVTDRPTKAHEYVFLLTKSTRYFFDQEAVKEKLLSSPEAYLRAGKSVRENHEYGEVAGRPLGDRSFASVPTGRNIRTVWTIPTEPTPFAHFATYPTALVEPCIKAGTSQRGCCPQCGAPYVRCVERADQVQASAKGSRFDTGKTGINGNGRTQPGERYETRTIGWRPSCECNAGAQVRATVLDPFFGAGTTGLVADRLQRDCIGIELNPAYAALAERRIAEDAGPMIADVTTEHRQMELFA